jgi:AcrR family transcriptional regulator
MAQSARSRRSATRVVAGVRRQEILDAAQACFRESGFHGTTVEDVAARAGLSKGAVYWHFKGKRELFLALLERYVNSLLERYADSFQEASRPTTGGTASAVEALRGMVEAVGPQESLEWVELSLEFMAHAGRDPDLRKTLLSMYRALRGAVQHQIERGIREGQLRRIDAGAFAAAAVATLDGLVVQKVIEPELDLASLWREAVDVLVRGIEA